MNMKKYIVSTEDINAGLVAALFAKYFSGFRIIKGQGFWKGKPEQSLHIEVLTQDDFAINEVANEIKKLNNQENVLIERYEVITELV